MTEMGEVAYNSRLGGPDPNLVCHRRFDNLHPFPGGVAAVQAGGADIADFNKNRDPGRLPVPLPGWGIADSVGLGVRYVPRGVGAGPLGPHSGLRSDVRAGILRADLFAGTEAARNTAIGEVGDHPLAVHPRWSCL